MIILTLRVSEVWHLHANPLPADRARVRALLRRRPAQTTQGKMDELKLPVSDPLSPTGSSRFPAKKSARYKWLD